jgi:hypothetical protein
LADSTSRSYLRRHVEAHLKSLGYSRLRNRRSRLPAPEFVGFSPVRGSLVYAETVLHGDLRSPQCHQRLLTFSQRRTRRRSSILFFIGVAEADERALAALLEQLDIRTGTRGGHVHVVPIAAA